MTGEKKPIESSWQLIQQRCEICVLVSWLNCGFFSSFESNLVQLFGSLKSTLVCIEFQCRLSPARLENMPSQSNSDNLLQLFIKKLNPLTDFE